MIENYPNQRRMHCETGLLVNMLKYYGVEMSEPMAFGIGGGIYFLYMPLIKTVDDLVFLILRTMPVHVIMNVAKRLHMDYHEEKFGNDIAKARAALDEQVAKNVPVCVVVNTEGLEYLKKLEMFKSYIASGQSMSFNGHMICIIGEEGSEYIIADVDFRLPNDDYVRLDKDELNRVRFIKGFAAPHGRMIYLNSFSKDIMDPENLKPAIVAGLKEACKNMLKIPFPYFGYKGLHYFAKDLRKWESKYNREQINARLLKYYRLIERGGTGGAGYRIMYSDFLKESAVIFQSDALQESAALMTKAADYWRQFSVNCGRFMKEGNITINEMSDIIEEVSLAERNTFEYIKKNFLKQVK